MNDQQQKQVARKIADSYTAKQPTKFDELKALDKKIKTPATVFSYIFGVLGALVLGVGMCLAMKILADMMALGIVIGVVGLIMVSVNYTFYKLILKNSKKKYGEQALKLSQEILAE